MNILSNPIVMLGVAAILISIIFIVLAFVGLAKLSKNSMSAKEAKMANIFIPLGFGWMIALLIYFLSTKKKLSSVPELSEAGKIGLITGIGLSFVLGLSLFGAFFAIAYNEGVKLEKLEGTNTVKNKNIMTEEDFLPKSLEENNAQKVLEGTTFKATAPCDSEIQTQKNQEMRTDMFMCSRNDNEVYFIAETTLPQIADVGSPEVQAILQNTAEFFYKGADAKKLTEEAMPPNAVLTKGKKNSGENIAAKFKMSKTSDGKTALHQIVVIAKESEVNMDKFNQFADSLTVK